MSSRLPALILMNALITLWRIVTPRGSMRRIGQCRRANSTNVRCVDPLRSTSIVDTMKRTQGGSSVGNQ